MKEESGEKRKETDLLQIALQEEEEKRKLLELSEISLWLDSYNDIFSSFDSRPYSERALSDDFLSEAQKAVVDKDDGKICLRFLLPNEKRGGYRPEDMIKKRLRDHFTKHYERLQKEKGYMLKKGATFVLFGTILMFIATFVLLQSEKTFLLNFLVILLEPAGWFFFWEGLGTIVFDRSKLNPNLDFYKKMAKCKVEFFSY